MTEGRPAAAALFLLSALLLAACPTVDFPRYGPSKKDVDGSAAGTVTGFGSIRVAGTEFPDNSSAAISDDRGRGFADIAAGMAVTVRGSIGPDYERGTMASVTIEREVRGPVDDNGVAPDNGTIRVLGQTVLVTPATVIVDIDGGGIGLDALKEVLDGGRRPGLEVHGCAEDNGIIHASYITRVPDGVSGDDDARLRGTISGFDAASRSFRIGAQRVSYAGLPPDGKAGWPGTGLADGLVVDVCGFLDADGGSGILRTDRAGGRVAVVDVDLGGPSDRAVLEGYVLSGGPSSFAMTVPGGKVTVRGDVVPAGDVFGPRKKVRVEGTLEGSGGAAVRARSVVVLPALDILLEGAPEDLSGAAGNTIVLLGKTVESGRFTLFRDPKGGVREGFGLSSVHPGDIVRVIGSLDATGTVEASRVDRIDGTPGRITFQGPVSSWARPISLSILGVAVNTSSARIDYYDRGGVAIAGRDAFYSRLESLGAGTLVRARGGEFVPAHSRIDAPAGGDRMEIEIVTVNR